MCPEPCNHALLCFILISKLRISKISIAAVSFVALCKYVGAQLKRKASYLGYENLKEVVVISLHL